MRKAKIAYEVAKLTRELAELNDEEDRQVGYPQLLTTADAEIARSEGELSRAAERVKWADRMFEKGFISKSQKVSDGLALQKAEFSLQQAVTSRKVLVDYTKDKTAKALRIGVEKARADELDKQTAWEREKTREVDLERRFDREPNRSAAYSASKRTAAVQDGRVANVCDSIGKIPESWNTGPLPRLSCDRTTERAEASPTEA